MMQIQWQNCCGAEMIKQKLNLLVKLDNDVGKSDSKKGFNGIPSLFAAFPLRGATQLRLALLDLTGSSPWDQLLNIMARNGQKYIKMNFKIKYKSLFL